MYEASPGSGLDTSHGPRGRTFPTEESGRTPDTTGFGGTAHAAPASNTVNEAAFKTSLARPANQLLQLSDAFASLLGVGGAIRNFVGFNEILPIQQILSGAGL